MTSTKRFAASLATILFCFGFGSLGTLAFIAGSGGVATTLGVTNPVLTDFKITQIFPSNDGHAVISGEFDLLRADECEFFGFDWRFGVRGGRTEPVNVKPFRKVERVNGLQVFGPWIIELTKDQVLDQSFADTIHKCGFFKIPVRTKIYR